MEDERERDGKRYAAILSSEFSDSMPSLVGAKPSLMGGWVEKTWLLDVVSPWILPFAMIVAPELIDLLQAEPTTCITCSFLLGARTCKCV